MKYGDKREYKKINFYNKLTGEYLCSTTWSKTCKQAMQYMSAWNKNGVIVSRENIKASYK